MSRESRAGCGGILTFVGDGLLLLVIESIGFDENLFGDISPVVTAGATLAEAFVHASLGLGPVFDYGAGGEGTFGASHDGRWVRWRTRSVQLTGFI